MGKRTKISLGKTVTQFFDPIVKANNFYEHSVKMGPKVAKKSSKKPL